MKASALGSQPNILVIGVFSLLKDKDKNKAATTDIN